MKKTLGVILGLALASMARGQAIADYAQLISNFAVRLDSGSGVAGGSVTGGTCTNQFVRSLDTSGVPTCATVSLTADVTGLLPFANIANGSALSLFGRAANSGGVMASITAAAASDCVFRESGSTLACGTIATAGIGASQVTLAKIANAAANSKLLGSGAAGSGSAYSELTLGTGLSMSGTTLNAASAGTVNQLTTVYTHEEFLGNRTAATSTCGGGGGGLGLAVTNTGGTSPGSVTNITGSADHPGLCQWETGTSAAAGATSLNNMIQNVTPQGTAFSRAATLEWETCVTALSDASNTYQIYQGFGDSVTGVEATDGCYFAYTNGTNSGNWVGTCSTAGVRTSSNTAVAPTVCPTFQRLTITVNSNATSVSFATDGTTSAGGAVASNIPTGTNVFGLQYSINKTAGAGTTSRGFQLDFIDLNWTVSR